MKRIFLIFAGATLMAGCSRAPTAGPATQPAQPKAVVSRSTSLSPATSPATTRPSSIILIDKNRYEFPPAILQIHKKDGQLIATLMSDDPKDAIDENYHGNSFYVQMPLDGTDLKNLVDAPWRFSDQSGERSDSPNGIFLDGNRLQLQPSMAQIKFSPGAPGPMMLVTISGEFTEFQTRDDTQPPKFVSVLGEFDAEVREK